MTVTWSTRELAYLAGTTVNTIRHYHAVGLLESPERRYNGYKQYRVRHLVRLLQVRRIVELGVPLAQVDVVGDDELARLGELRELDSHVAGEIARLERARDDIAALLRVRAPVDTARGFESIAADLSEPDRSLILVLSGLYDDKVTARLREVVASEPGHIRRAFDALRPDAGESVRRHVADEMAAGSVSWRSAERPWLTDDLSRRRTNDHETRAVVIDVVNELYNPAQRDVLRRVEAAAHPADIIEVAQQLPAQTA